MSAVHEFYAVTCNSRSASLYLVSDKDDSYGHATAKKIALRGESVVPVGEMLGGSMIAVCDKLVAHIPDGEWVGWTSPIVALFLDSKSATKCFGEADLVPCDPRWRAETEEVVKGIGKDNQFFSVCERPNHRLLNP